MLAKNPIHAALYRPVLYGGVAPQLLLFEASAVFLLLFEAGLHLLTVGLCLFYCLVFHPLAVWLCAKDPLVADLYVRSLRGRDFYCATPALGARCLRVDPALPEGR
ncbi:MAG TPA: VirB3 family type IV secretion system protein [Thermoanaerobaculia bacterium]|nr:VirB3 family type IV secretion system protein [Thermoanaerobaculia bacterium]